MMTDARSVLTELAPLWGEHEAAAERAGSWRLAAENVQALRDSGLLAAPVPKALGGWGISLVQAADAIRILARKAPSTALALAMPWGNAAMSAVPESAVDASARAEHRSNAAWVAEQTRSGKILAVANSEPGAHGDLMQTKTTVKEDNGTFALNGRKAFATFGPDADYFMCAARGGDMVDGFFVSRTGPGITLDERWNSWGMRSTASVGLTLANAKASAIYGYRGALSGTNARHWSTVLFAAVFVGIGEGAVELASDRVDADSIWPRAKLAEHVLALEAAWGFVQAIALSERWPFPSAEAARARDAKTFAARTAITAATDSLVMSGSRAYGADSLAAKLVADAAAGSLLRPPLVQHMDEMAAAITSARGSDVAAIKKSDAPQKKR